MNYDDFIKFNEDLDENLAHFKSENYPVSVF